MGEPRKGNCRACGVEIVFLKCRNGKTIPIDSTSASGNDGTFNPTLGHYPHFSSCLKSDKLKEIIREENKKRDPGHGH